MSSMKSALQEEIVGKLAKIVAPEYVTTDENRLDELSWDALSEGRLHPANRPEVTSPFCSVLPASTDEVRRIVRLANEKKCRLFPMVADRDSWAGRCRSRRESSLICAGWTKSPDIDPPARSARVQAGTVLEELEKRLNRENFILGHDPWTLACCHGGRRDFH